MVKLRKSEKGRCALRGSLVFEARDNYPQEPVRVEGDATFDREVAYHSLEVIVAIRLIIDEHNTLKVQVRKARLWIEMMAGESDLANSTSDWQDVTKEEG
jgi:hypothetical protein